MTGWDPRFAFVGLVLLLLPAAARGEGRKTPSPAGGSSPGAAAVSRADPAELHANIVRAMTAYKTSLEELRKLYQKDFDKKARLVPERRDLYERGYISRLELEQSQQELTDAEAKVADVERRIAEAKMAIAETTAFRALLKLPSLGAGEYLDKGAFVRYNGRAGWSLADAGRIEKFFSGKFGRPLPISALGQTSLHDRMRLDHREAMDVALQPDSSEGAALMAYLRKQGIPFIAFRNGVPGAATGAHIHIGRPSLRFSAR